MKTWKADAALFLNAFIWGTTFVVVKSAIADIPTPWFLFLRFSVATVVLAAIYRRNWQRAALGPGLLAGLFLFLGYIFQTAGLELTTPSKSAFLTGLSIPMVPLAAALVYRKSPRPAELAGVALATAGMALLTLPSGGFSVNRGDLLSICCAAAFACHLVVLAYFSPRAGFETVSVVQVAVSAALSLAFAAAYSPPRIRWSASVVFAILITGLFATALAFTVQTWAQRYTTPTRTALIYSLEPAIAWFTSYVLTGETLARRGMIGALLILSGILLVEVKRAQPASHPLV